MVSLQLDPEISVSLNTERSVRFSFTMRLRHEVHETPSYTPHRWEQQFCRTQSDNQATSLRNKVNGREEAGKSKEKAVE